MAHKPTFSAQFTPEQLDDLRKLAKQLDFVLRRGTLQGEGSPRQLMIALADAVQRHGALQVATAIKPIIGKQ